MRLLAGKSKISFAAVALMLSALAGYANADEVQHEVSSLKITILSTMLTVGGIGEWGYSALVEADGHRILFDTGNRPDTVLRNAESFGVDLAGVEEVVLSHFHGDHTGGLVALRRALAKTDESSLVRAHVARGIFWERPSLPASRTRMSERKKEFESLGGTFIEHERAVEIHPGIWLTGPVPRLHPERNYGNPFDADAPRFMVQTPDGPMEDNVPDSMSMVINTSKGLVVMSGCGHAGMINTLEHARNTVRPAPIHAAIGGFHLLAADDTHLAWTAEKLVEFDTQNFVGAHCTGIEPVYQFRDLARLERSHSVVGATGATFTLDDGINPLLLAR